MRRIGFGNHRIASRDRGRKVPAGDAVEGEGEIVWPEYCNRAESAIARPNVGLAVDGCHPPRFISGCFGGEPELTDGSRKFHIGEARGLW